MWGAHLLPHIDADADTEHAAGTLTQEPGRQQTEGVGASRLEVAGRLKIPVSCCPP
jgi:hypothetical protein